MASRLQADAGSRPHGADARCGKSTQGRVRRHGPRYIKRRRLDDSRRAEQAGGRSRRKGNVMSDVRHHGVVEDRDDIDPGNADVGAAAEAVFRRAAPFVGVIVRGTLSRGSHYRKLVAALDGVGASGVSGDIGREAEQFGPARPGEEQFVRCEHEKAHRNHLPRARRTASPVPTWESFPQRALT